MVLVSTLLQANTVLLHWRQVSDGSLNCSDCKNAKSGYNYSTSSSCGNWHLPLSIFTARFGFPLKLPRCDRCVALRRGSGRAGEASNPGERAFVSCLIMYRPESRNVNVTCSRLRKQLKEVWVSQHVSSCVSRMTCCRTSLMPPGQQKKRHS